MTDTTAPTGAIEAKTDRELLELAAKAAGLKVWQGQWPQEYMLFAPPKKPDATGVISGVEWNPLTDDGDAFRLAVKLKLNVGYSGWNQVFAEPITTDEGCFRESGERAGIHDPYAATRRCIVRAAAAIGRSL